MVSCDVLPGQRFRKPIRRRTAVFLTSRTVAARVAQISAPAHEEGRGFRKSASAETPQKPDPDGPAALKAAEDIRALQNNTYPLVVNLRRRNSVIYSVLPCVCPKPAHLAGKARIAGR